MSWLKESDKSKREMQERHRQRSEAEMTQMSKERQEAIERWKGDEKLVHETMKKWDELQVDRILEDVQRELLVGRLTPLSAEFKPGSNSLTRVDNGWQGNTHIDDVFASYPYNTEGGSALITYPTVSEALAFDSGMKGYHSRGLAFSHIEKEIYHNYPSTREGKYYTEDTTKRSTSLTLGLSTSEVLVFGDTLGSLDEIRKPRDLEVRLNNYLTQRYSGR